MFEEVNNYTQLSAYSREYRSFPVHDETVHYDYCASRRVVGLPENDIMLDLTIDFWFWQVSHSIIIVCQPNSVIENSILNQPTAIITKFVCLVEHNRNIWGDRITSAE